MCDRRQHDQWPLNMSESLISFLLLGFEWFRSCLSGLLAIVFVPRYIVKDHPSNRVSRPEEGYLRFSSLQGLSLKQAISHATALQTEASLTVRNAPPRQIAAVSFIV